MNVALYIGNDRLDLSKDESIEVNSSIANSEDITKNTTEYSKGFTVPASSINNRIFKHYYDADIDNTFDARIKVDGRIEIDGLPFRSGKFRLDKVGVKNGRPSYYSINFFGKLVSLKDKLRDDKLSALDFSELDHVHNSANAKTGLTSGLSSGQLVYNLLTKKRFYYDGDTANLAPENIAVSGVRWNDIRPALNVYQIIRKIEDTYGVLFSNHFFGRTEFKKLYLWLNSNDQTQGAASEQLIDWTSGNGSDFGLNHSTNIWTGSTFYTNSNTYTNYRYRITITPSAGFETAPYKIVVRNFGQQVAIIEATGTFETEFLSISAFVSTPFSYTFHIQCQETFTYSAAILLRKKIPLGISDRQSFAAANTLIDIFNVSPNLPDMKILDFLKGLFQMFKLVMVQDGGDIIYINTLNDFYAAGKLYNITPYVNADAHDVERGKLLNEISFKYQDPTTILNQQFKKTNNTAYGDLYSLLTDANGELLDGERLEFALPFEQILYERLSDADDNLITNIQYGAVITDGLQPASPKAHLFYNIVQPIGSKAIKFINDDNSLSTLSGNINTPAHTMTFAAIEHSLVWGNEFSTWDGSLITNTLYSRYHQDYITAIFNIKRRTFKFKAKLPLHIVTGLRLNDILRIGEGYYRIDNFTTDIISGDVSLTLINSFDNVINAVSANTTIVFADYRAQAQSVYVSGADMYLADDSWATLTIEDDGVYTIDFTENTTGDYRQTELTNGNDFKIDVIQNYDN